jgi:hypothetical protein
VILRERTFHTYPEIPHSLELTMPRNNAPDQVFAHWQRKFAADAVADDANEIRRHIEYLGLDCSRADMLEGTDLLLAAAMAYQQMNSLDCEDFVKQQRYWLRGVDLPFYCLTSNLGKKHFGRLLTNKNMDGVDFADLFNHPWYPFETAGFYEVHISRLDGEPIEPEELEALELRFTEDMHYDYTDEEVSAYIQMSEFDDTAVATAVEIRF